MFHSLRVRKITSGMGNKLENVTTFNFSLELQPNLLLGSGSERLNRWMPRSAPLLASPDLGVVSDPGSVCDSATSDQQHDLRNTDEPCHLD